MTRIFLTLIIALCSIAANAQLEYTQGSFRQINADAVEAGEDLGSRNMTENFIKEWPDDFNGNQKCALVRAVFTNVPFDQIRDNVSLSLSGGYYHVVGTEFIPGVNGIEMWTFVDPTDGHTTDLTYTQTDGSLGHATVPNVKLEAGRMYTLEINNKLRVTVNIGSTPPGLGVQIDGKYYGDTPISIPEMTTGDKRLVLTVPDGTEIDASLLPTSIRVNENSTNFNFDLRKKHEVKFASHEHGTLYIDNEYIGPIPGNYTMRQGTYNVSARGANGVNLDFPITVNSATTEIPLVFTPSLTMHFASQYDGANVKAALQITGPNGSQVKNGIYDTFDTPATVLLPYGTYRLNTTYTTPSGATVTKDEKVKVKAGTDPFHLTTLPIKTVHANIFQRDFPRRSWGISASYLQRWYSYKIDGRSHNCDWLGEDGKQSGIQFGIAYQPYFGYGLGLNTGFFGQYFWADKDVSTSSVKFEEWDLYIPMHLMFRIPVKDFDFHINTGVGFEYGVSLKAVYSGDESGSEKIEFDEGTPKAFNMYYEIGAGIRFKALQLNFVYGLGLTGSDNFLTDDLGNSLKAKPNKLGLTLGLMF